MWIKGKIKLKKNCCDLNLGESLCIVTLSLFSGSGLNLLNGFDFYFDLFWMAWPWKPAIARGRVRTMTELPNMAAILQIIASQTHAASLQLTPVKTRYLLASITWPYRGFQFTANPDHVFWSWLLHSCWFRLDRGLMSDYFENRAGLFGSRLTLTHD